MKKRIAIVFLGFCLGFLGMALDEGLAVEAYPSRALTMIVPFPPGGVADLTARPLAAAMEADAETTRSRGQQGRSRRPRGHSIGSGQQAGRIHHHGGPFERALLA